jgi:TRAP-type C4-dicarboxylate transport system permease small subunit
MLLDTFKKKLDVVEDAFAAIAGAMFLFMLTAICIDVVMRYMFNNPMGWVIEVCEYLLLYITFLGAAWLLRENGQVRVDIVMMLLPAATERYFMIVTSFAAAVACLILCIISGITTFEQFISKMLEIKTLNVPKWIVMVVIPIGSLLVSIEFLRQGFAWLQRSKSDDNINNQ